MYHNDSWFGRIFKKPISNFSRNVLPLFNKWTPSSHRWLVMICWWLMNSKFFLQKYLSRGVLIKRCSENLLQIYRRISMRRCDFNKAANQLYWNHSSGWLFSCKFAAHFQEHIFVRTPLEGCFCFPVKFTKFLRTSILKNICKGLVLHLVKRSRGVL